MDRCLPNKKRSRWKSGGVFEFGIRAMFLIEKKEGRMGS